MSTRLLTGVARGSTPLLAAIASETPVEGCLCRNQVAAGSTPVAGSTLPWTRGLVARLSTWRCGLDPRWECGLVANVVKAVD